MATTLTERFRFVSPVETEHPFHVTNFTGVEGLHRLFDFHIDLVCADAAVDTGKLLAAPCRFEILRDGDAAPAIFSGYPARVEQRGFFNGYAYYSVHLRPTLWKLTRIRQSAIFLGKKLEDVLRELINSQTFFQFPHEFRLTAGDYPAPEFAMQYQETLYDYLCWRMEEQGAYFTLKKKTARTRSSLPTRRSPTRPEARRRSFMRPLPVWKATAGKRLSFPFLWRRRPCRAGCAAQLRLAQSQ